MITVLLFTVLNEAIIEYLFGNVEQVRPYLPMVSLTIAIALCFAFRIDLFMILLGFHSASGLDILLSGFIISRLSNYLNDFVQRFFRSK